MAAYLIDPSQNGAAIIWVMKLIVFRQQLIFLHLPHLSSSRVAAFLAEKINIYEKMAIIKAKKEQFKEFLNQLTFLIVSSHNRAATN
jgi:hypothetical protein